MDSNAASAVPEVLAMLPARIQAFINELRAVGIAVRYGERLDKSGNPLVSLHGAIAQFMQLTAMTKCRIPKRYGHWRLRCGIIGTLYRVTEQELVGVIHRLKWAQGEASQRYPQLTPENARKEAAEEEARLKQENESSGEIFARSADAYMRKGPESFLKSMPNSAMKFRRKLICDLRQHAQYYVDQCVAPSPLHGFTFSAESGDAIKLSLDAVVEAILAADVALDDVRHTGIRHKLQTYIVAAGRGAPRQVALVTKPNPSLLSESAS